jgi:hypothetical protein
MPICPLYRSFNCTSGLHYNAFMYISSIPVLNYAYLVSIDIADGHPTVYSCILL